MEIYLIRHTSPGVPKGTYYGHTDVPLANTFARDIEAVKAKLPSQFGAIVTSPLTRCVTLARELNSNIFRTDDRIVEMSLGEWEMRSHEEIGADVLDRWMNNFVDTPPPAGESFRHLYGRVVPFYEELLRSDFDTVAVVTHGGVIRSILNYVLGIPLERSFSYDIDHGSVTMLDLYTVTGAPNAAKVKYVNR
jgi:alpha-ribazole phosphatase